MRIPIVTIGGYLGAGKTTLVNRLLSDERKKRIVVFVNDFGEINVDHALIDAVEEDKISLKNGCVCCTLNEDLIGQVMAYVNQPDRPDGFFIEASGVADPGVLEASINTLETSGAVRADMRLYVVDAENFHLLSYEDSERVIDHAVASDLILINKADQARPERLQALKETLHVSAPYSLLMETVFCDLGAPLDMVLNDTGRARRSLVGAENEKIGTLKKPQFSQWSTAHDGVVDRRGFDDFLRELPGLCWRAKGFLVFSDDLKSRYVFHFVGNRASLEKLSEVDSPTSLQFVAIGKADLFQPHILEKKFFETLIAPLKRAVRA